MVSFWLRAWHPLPALLAAWTHFGGVLNRLVHPGQHHCKTVPPSHRSKIAKCWRVVVSCPDWEVLICFGVVLWSKRHYQTKDAIKIWLTPQNCNKNAKRTWASENGTLVLPKHKSLMTFTEAFLTPTAVKSWPSATLMTPSTPLCWVKSLSDAAVKRSAKIFLRASCHSGLTPVSTHHPKLKY